MGELNSPAPRFHGMNRDSSSAALAAAGTAAPAPAPPPVTARMPPTAPATVGGAERPQPSKPPQTGAPDTDDLTSCAGARAVVSAVLSACPADTAQCEADAHLAVTELVSNAQRHAQGMTGFSVSLSPDAHRLHLVVEDASPQPPHSAIDGNPGAVGGRGWAIVRRLAETCHVTLLPGIGKRITVTLPIPT